ncbi:unnamed protein product [Albugo candida]|nr:unnamed protein product [Albugo candida]|eukprot:CCI40674.1 unnamed protein product [Albugo candida]
MEENDLGTVPIVMKIYKKSHAHERLEDIRLHLKKIQRVFRPVHRYPNVIMYQDFQVSAKYPVAYLVRPFVANNLYDRIHSRPFLTLTEKVWIAFQLLKALVQIHSLKVCHGDIKLENCMITTWNWVLLTDFAPFKPTLVPENDPTEYHYYFCAIDNPRRSCTLAPERFYTTEGYKNNKLEKRGIDHDDDVSVSRDGRDVAQNREGSKNLIGDLTIAEGNSSDRERMEAWMLSNLANSKVTLEEADRHLSKTKYRSRSEIVDEKDTTSNRSSKQATKSQKDDEPTASKNSTSSRIDSLKPAMDIFSAGCVIAEVFLGGKPLFDLTSLLKYRLSGDVSPIAATLEKIKYPALEKLILHMIQLDSQARWTATQYMERFKDTVFPPYFENFLFSFFSDTLSHAGRSSDSRISIVAKYYRQMVKASTGFDDKEGEKFFIWRLKNHENYELVSSWTEEAGIKAKSDSAALSTPRVPGLDMTETKKCTVDSGQQSNTKLYQQYISQLRIASFQGQQDGGKTILKGNQSDTRIDSIRTECVGNGSISTLNPLWKENETNGIMITLSIITSCLRHVRRTHSKLTALFLIHALSRFVTDEIRLQRLIPYILESITDKSALVRAQAIRSTAFILDLITVVPLADASVFTQYIFPTITPSISDSDISVRIAFAECLPCMASVARRFVEITETLRFEMHQTSQSSKPPTSSSSAATTNESNALYSYQCEKLINQLHQLVSNLMIQLNLSDRPNSHFVKRALLLDLTRLSVFFGRKKTVDFLLPQLITFTNDRNGELRRAVFDEIAGVCVFVGKITAESYILPHLQQALHDTEEHVVVSALQCLRSLVQIGLFHRRYSGMKTHLFSACSASMCTESLIDKASSAISLISHPSWWVRDTVFRVLASIVMQLGIIDTEIFLVPLIRPYLKKPLALSHIAFSTTPSKSIAQANDAESIVFTILRDCCMTSFRRKLFAGGNSGTAGNVEANFIEEGVVMRNEVGKRNFASIKSQLEVAGSTFTEIGSRMQRYPERREVSNMVECKPPIPLRVDAPTSKSGKIQSVRANVYALRVPDMRFALVVNSLAGAKSDMTFIDQSNSFAIIDTGPHKKNVGPAALSKSASLKYPASLDDIVQQYGLKIPSVPASVTSKSVFKNDKRSTSSSHEYPTPNVHSVPSFSDSNASKYGTNFQRPELPNACARFDTKDQEPATQSNIDPAILEPHGLLLRLKALQIPCLPPDFGALQASNGSGKHYSMYADYNSAFSIFQPAQLNLSRKNKCVRSLDGIGANGSEGVLASLDEDVEATNARLQATSFVRPASEFILDTEKLTSEEHIWRPRKNVLVAEFSEHTDPVIRIKAAQDSSFLASASLDGTVKIWALNSLHDKKKHKSRAAFDIQDGMLTDMLVLDNSHSVICSSLTGNLQVFRIERVSKNRFRADQKRFASYDVTIVSEIKAQADPIMALDYFNTITEALVIYATWSGTIHAWDLRVHRGAWTIQVPLQLGYVTCMAHSPGLMWLTAATSKGFVCLWDLRFLVLLRVWRHSSRRPIHRILACPKKHNGKMNGDALAYISTEDGYVSLFDLNTGKCHGIYRSMTSERVEGIEAMRSSVLHHIPFSRKGGILGTNGLKDAIEEIDSTSHSNQNSIVRSIISPMTHYASAQEAIITGGDDGRIRYWDLQHPEAGFTVCGEGDCSSIYEESTAMQNEIKLPTSTKRFVNPRKVSQPCGEASSPPVTTCWEQKKDMETHSDIQRKGISLESSNCIIDMAIVDFHGPLVASSTRAGVVKFWR